VAAVEREGGLLHDAYGLAIPACLWVLVKYPFELPAPAALFHHAARAVLLGAVALSMISI